MWVGVYIVGIVGGLKVGWKSRAGRQIRNLNCAPQSLIWHLCGAACPAWQSAAASDPIVPLVPPQPGRCNPRANGNRAARTRAAPRSLIERTPPPWIPNGFFLSDAVRETGRPTSRVYFRDRFYDPDSILVCTCELMVFLTTPLSTPLYPFLLQSNYLYISFDLHLLFCQFQRSILRLVWRNSVPIYSTLSVSLL